MRRRYRGLLPFNTTVWRAGGFLLVRIGLSLDSSGRSYLEKNSDLVLFR